jgi:hypothetical protein
MKTTAVDILIDTIYEWGVEVVFGLPGDGINGIMEALRKRIAATVMRSHIGEVFTGIVTRASDKGTWVRVSTPPMEGKL